MALVLHSCGHLGTFAELDLSASEIPPGVVWIDLLSPTPEESAFVERATGLHVPNFAEVSEIESSSRLRLDHGVFYLSSPASFRSLDKHSLTTSVGFVVSQSVLITVRFEKLPAFETFSSEVHKPGNVHPSSIGAFIGLLEAIVDRIADVLEHVGGELDDVSHYIFREQSKRQAKEPAHEERDLRETLRAVGRSGDLISRLRDTLMGLSRIVPYVANRGVPWIPADMRPMLETLRLDVVSLNEYDAYLSNKVQFLLDATLGLINIEQNNIIKVLTIVASVGVPPTLVASWYGMNFKHIPELDWTYGYPYVIALAILSSVGSLYWFKKRGWF